MTVDTTVDAHGDELGPRHHYLSRRQIGEAEDAVQHLFFLLFEHAGFLAGRHEHLQLFFRVDAAAMAFAVHAETGHNRLRGRMQEVDERPERAHVQFGRLDRQHVSRSDLPDTPGWFGPLERAARSLLWESPPSRLVSGEAPWPSTWQRW